MDNIFGDNIARDKIINNYGHEFPCEFAEIEKQELYYSEIKPELGKLLNILKENKILFIFGDLSDKKKIARLLALELKKIKSREDFFAFELLDKSDDNISIRDYIYKNKKSGCFLLQGLKSESLLTFYKEFKSSVEKNFFLIITTDDRKELSGFPPEIKNILQEVDDKDLYTEDQFKFFALKKIKEFKEEEILVFEKNLEKVILEKTSSIKSFIKQEQFLQEIIRINKKSDLENNIHFLDIIYEKISDDIQGFQLWFDYSLNDEDRMLVISLSIFHGMNAEQTFAILDRIVDEVWRPRRVNLTYYDYKDIKKISTHFEIVGYDIELKNDRFPVILFEYCWKNYRRLLTTLLPVVVKFAKESIVKTNKINHEIFGDKTKRERLRSSVSLFLGRIALLDFNFVETYILGLGTIQNDGAVSIAAKAISYAYYEGDNKSKDKIIILMESWLDKNSYIYGNTIVFLKAELEVAENNKITPVDCLQILTGYVLMHIIKRYPPDKPIDKLAKLLFILIDSSSIAVRNKLVSTVLSSIYTTNFGQFYKEIDRLICTYELQDFFISIIKKNFITHQDAVQELLNRWFENLTDESFQNILPDRKKLLLTGLNILRDNHNSDFFRQVFDKEKIGSILKKIIIQIRDREVRLLAFDLLLDISGEQLDDFDVDIQNLISFLDIEEKKLLVNKISEKYMLQRKNLSGGEIKREIGGEYYDLWIEHGQFSRPSLLIEKVMDIWLKDGGVKEAAQLSYIVQTNFINIFENQERKVINDIIKESRLENWNTEKVSFEEPYISEPVNNSTEEENLVKTKFSFRNWYAESLLIPLSIRKRYPNEEKVIRAILPIILDQEQNERNDMLYRLSLTGRWELAEAIRRLIQLDQNKFIIIMLIIIAILILLIIFREIIFIFI